ncbi:TylF/MycF/NovP-related O-methyltransferase [Microcoleus sp. F10-C6]|uniref:TylF/MycF/NovP-related O-methyltransferase n=1 Tax=unclassified Microcoleus TaxID=2642155 RepID=UPI002FCEEE53
MSTERTIVFSTKHQVTIKDRVTPDIDKDPVFLELFEQVLPYTMTSKEALFALYTSVNYVLDRNIPGDIVECGVWRGGSSLLAALILQARKVSDRKLYLYDTFNGMTAPTEIDVDKRGNVGFEMMEKYADNIGWCYALLEEVQATFFAHNFEFEIHYVQGDVLETSKTTKPETISVLRLDTDWYESTAAELEQFYPRLSTGGVLIIDDYGAWAGSRQATDEYFSKVPAPMLKRIDKEVRLGIKI